MEHKFVKNGFYAHYNPSSAESIRNAGRYVGATKREIERRIKREEKAGYAVH